jgi:RNA polymerase sigma factor (sigma-70 family)
LETERLIELVAGAKRGDTNALHELYLDAYRSIFYLALRMVKNHADAEDITQEVCITVHEKISDLREAAAFYGWVNQITVNKCNRFLSKYPGISRFDDEADILSIVDDNPLSLPDRGIDDEDTRRIILEVVDSLPESQRACVMLFYYAEFTVAKIAETLEVNENTVKSRLSLARAKIRAALEEKERKEGIKLWGIPISLTPILRQAMEELALPDGMEARMWESIQNATNNPGSTSGQVDPMLGADSAVIVAKTGGILAGGKAIAAAVLAVAVVGGGFLAAHFTDLITLPFLPTISQTGDVTPQDTDTTPDTHTSDDGDGDTSQAQDIDNSLNYMDGNNSTDPTDRQDATDLPDGFHRYEYGDWIYEGYWANGLPSGEGVLTGTFDSDTIIITANFVDGMAHGTMTYTLNQLGEYSGVWSFDVNMGLPTEAEAMNEEQVGLTHVNTIYGVPPWGMSTR